MRNLGGGKEGVSGSQYVFIPNNGLLRKIKIWVDSGGGKGVYIYIYLPFKSLSIALYLARDLKFKNSAWCQHCVFVLYRVQKKTEIFALYDMNRLVFFYNRGGECLLRGTD